ncbi:hypothetical protein BC830DRAFT_904337 [Chytriomyces sp. MP71]|nr:hypothetical protein BC830DRAFT_904337 [Chytriomyces sp. MP71]
MSVELGTLSLKEQQQGNDVFVSGITERLVSLLVIWVDLVVWSPQNDGLIVNRSSIRKTRGWRRYSKLK